MNNIRVSLCMDKESYDKLRELSSSYHISMSSTVRLLVNDRFQNIQKKDGE